jgi:hypothetical protein
MNQFLRCVLQLLVAPYVVPSSLIISTLMMEALHSFETSVITSATRRHVPDDGILHSHRSHIAQTDKLIHDILDG